MSSEKKIALRKVTNELGIITAIEIKQLNADPTTAQQYLDASAWWLHRAPFGVERLPVTLIAHMFKGSLVSVDGWNVTSLDLQPNYFSAAVPLESLGPLPANLKELTLNNVSVADFSPLRDLEILSVRECSRVRDISGLRGCQHLEVLDLWRTGVTDLGALAGAVSLEELTCSGTGIATLTPLATCHNLKKLTIWDCSSISDLSPLAHLASLEEIDCSETRVTTLAPLATCRNLREVHRWRCRFLEDLSSLAGAPSLERLDARESGVRKATGLDTCPNLKTLLLDGTMCARLSR